MKRSVAIATGFALAGTIAAAQQQEEQDEQEYDRDRSIITESEREDRTGMDDPTDMGDYDTRSQTQPTDSEEPQPETGKSAESGARAIYGAETVTSASELSAAELVGRPVILEDGGLVGTIQEVGYSEMHQARVATVDVSGFVGAGEKVIAIPLSDLRTGGQDSVTTSTTREWIETQEAFDESDLRPDR